MYLKQIYTKNDQLMHLSFHKASCEAQWRHLPGGQTQPALLLHEIIAWSNSSQINWKLSPFFKDRMMWSRSGLLLFCKLLIIYHYNSGSFQNFGCNNLNSCTYFALATALSQMTTKMRWSTLKRFPNWLTAPAVWLHRQLSIHSHCPLHAATYWQTLNCY